MVADVPSSTATASAAAAAAAAASLGWSYVGPESSLMLLLGISGIDVMNKSEIMCVGRVHFSGVLS